MRYLRYAFLAALGTVLLAISLANRSTAQVKLVPDELVPIIGVQFSVSLPLFVIVLVSAVFGIIIGFVWEWLRESGHRHETGLKSRRIRGLEREIQQLKGERDKDRDPVLALLEDTK